MNHYSILLYSEVLAPSPPDWVLAHADELKTSSKTQARVLHSVENIIQDITSIQIGIDYIDLDLILIDTKWCHG
jgi:hypothetical protein